MRATLFDTRQHERGFSYIALMFGNRSKHINVFVGFFKTLLLAATWTYVTISLPMTAMKMKFTLNEIGRAHV